jgi:hypothetical protein
MFWTLEIPFKMGFSVLKTSRLVLHRKHNESPSQSELSDVNAGGTYSNHCASKG